MEFTYQVLCLEIVIDFLALRQIVILFLCFCLSNMNSNDVSLESTLK